MKESGTDRELKDLIKDTLDKYEEKYILGSWENFIRIKRRRRRFIFWLTGAGMAASLITGWLGFRVLFHGSSGSDVDYIVLGSDKMDTPYENQSLNDSLMIEKTTPIKAESINVNAVSRFAPEKKQDYEGNVFAKEAIKRESSRFVSDSGTKNEGTGLIPVNTKRIIIELFSDKQDLNLAYINDPSIIQGTIDKNIEKGTSVSDLVSKQSDLSDIEETDFSNKSRRNRIRLSLSLSPGLTSTNTSTAFNISGGLNADYELSRNILFSTGLLVENQKVVDVSSDSPSWIPSDKTQAELVDIDVPLNLKWKFMIKRSTSYYLGSGISSVIYLSEKYINTTYTQKMVRKVEMDSGESSVTYQLENVRNTDQEKETPLNTFDFAGRVNILVGIERSITSRVFLHLEPYIKIPVSDLATRDLRFTTSGINCKISF
jgi:hypothetical protein